MAKPDQMERVVNLCKRRGLIFPSSDIYGGFRSTWDYGPLGVLLKRNVKDAWWRSMVQLRDDIVGLDAAILMAPKVWEASGHLATFTDPLVDCRNCKERFRADQLPASGACPNCGAKDSFTDARQFNLMFKTFVGPVEDDASVAYLRPETAQGIFVNFLNVQTTARKKPPFGIAQIGKSFRNEITPGNFIFRTREFEQMEMEFFVPPEDGDEWFEYWCRERFRWYTDLGIAEDRLRLRPHDPEELSHYSTSTADVEFMYPWGWGELEGVANRGDYDLTQHAKLSGEDLTYYDQDNDRRYLPYVIEPAAGADRALLAFLLAAYEEEEVEAASGKTEKRTVLRLDPRLAPIKVAVLPLSKNDQLVPVADEVAGLLRPQLMIDVDAAGSIGRRYRRQDEVGTPLCVTIDFETLDDRAVTVRDRDSMTQDRVAIDGLVDLLHEKLGT
jgi:glycyl-tRNA synthetase